MQEGRRYKEDIELIVVGQFKNGIEHPLNIYQIALKRKGNVEINIYLELSGLGCFSKQIRIFNLNR